MKNGKENDYKIQIRIIFCLILLLFLLFFAQLFIIMYYKQSDCNIKSQKTTDGNANTNLNTASHQVKKREISSETEKENSYEENNATIVMTGKWNVKKSDLLEYCFNADDFCRRNRDKSEDEQKDSSGGEKQEEVKECILRNISDYKSFYYYEYKDKNAMENNYRLLFPQIEEGPENNYRLITQKWYERSMKEVTIIPAYFIGDEKVTILKEFRQPDEFYLDGYFERNGTFYTPYKTSSGLRIVKYDIETGNVTFAEKIHFVQERWGVFLLQDVDYFWVFDSLNQTKNQGPLYDNVFMAYKMDYDNLTVLSKQEFVLKNCYIWNTFVAYDKLYCVDQPKFSADVYIKSASNDVIGKYNFARPATYINFFQRPYYNVQEQHLYLMMANGDYLYKIVIKKLHFNCSNQG